MASINYSPGVIIPSSWLNDVNTQTYKSGINAKLSPYNAVGNGIADDTAALQAAANAALGGLLILPAGTYLISSAISISNSITVVGAGREITKIQLGSTTQNGFNVASDGAVHFRDFQIIGAGLGAATSGAGIRVNGATSGVTSNPHSTFLNLGFVFNWHGIEIISAFAERISGCQFFGILDAGIIKQDITFPDSGDGVISENFLTGNSASATLDGIRHLTGGGMHIINNSFIELGAAYRMLWDANSGSSQIFLHGNTIDQSMQVGGFVFDRTGSGSVFGISIKNNFFDVNTASPSIWFKTNNANVFSQVTISGNTHLVITGGTGIKIDGGVNYSIVGEQFVANSTGTGIATGNATATSIFIGKNHFNGIATPFAINTITQILGADYIADGAINLPSLAFFNSPNTGFYQPAPDQVGITISGTQRGLFSASGLTLANGTILTPGGVSIFFSSGSGNVNPSTDLTTTFGTASFRWLQVNTPTVINSTGVAVSGTNTNDNAAAGFIGEYVSSTLASGSSVSLATGVTSNVTSISLTAGDWDVTGTVSYTFGATTSYTNLIGGVSSTSATLGPQGNQFDYETAANVPTAAADSTWGVPIVRFSLSGTTTIFLVTQATFTVSTLKAYGIIRARRVR